jgi:hypothetical protein
VIDADRVNDDNDDDDDDDDDDVVVVVDVVVADEDADKDEEGGEGDDQDTMSAAAATRDNGAVSSSPRGRDRRTFKTSSAPHLTTNTNTTNTCARLMEKSKAGALPQNSNERRQRFVDSGGHVNGKHVPAIAGRSTRVHNTSRGDTVAHRPPLPKLEVQGIRNDVHWHCIAEVQPQCRQPHISAAAAVQVRHGQQG